MASYIVKLSYDGELRRFALPSGKFSELAALTRQILNVGSDGSHFVLKMASVVHRLMQFPP